MYEWSASVNIRAARPGDADVIVEFNRLMAQETENKVLDRAIHLAGTSFNGRTPASGAGYWGSNPCVPANSLKFISFVGRRFRWPEILAVVHVRRNVMAGVDPLENAVEREEVEVLVEGDGVIHADVLVVQRVGMHEAKTTLSKLVALAEAGEEVVIERRGMPVARLVAVEKPKVTRANFGGSMKGKIWMADDFDTMSEQELDDWYKS